MRDERRDERGHERRDEKGGQGDNHLLQHVAQPDARERRRQLGGGGRRGRRARVAGGEDVGPQRQRHERRRRVLRGDHDDLAHARDAEGDVGLAAAGVVEGVEGHLSGGLADGLRRELLRHGAQRNA